jgi:hypothetical protein
VHSLLVFIALSAFIIHQIDTDMSTNLPFILLLLLVSPWSCFQPFRLFHVVVGQTTKMNRGTPAWKENDFDLKKRPQPNSLKQFRGRFSASEGMSPNEEHHKQDIQLPAMSTGARKEAVATFLSNSVITHDQIAIDGVNGKYSLLPMEEEEAIVMQHTIYKLLKMLEISIRMSSSLIRISGDTTAGLVSGLMKGFGGLIDLVASLFSKFSHSLSTRTSAAIQAIHGNRTHSGPHLVFSTKVSQMQSKISTTLQNSAKLLSALSQTCIWSGEITESLTSGLGEALQDSFRGLELLSQSSHKVVHYLLDLNSSFSHSTKPLMKRPLIQPYSQSTKKMSVDQLPNADIPSLINTTDGTESYFNNSNSEESEFQQRSTIYSSLSSKLRLQKSRMKERSLSLSTNESTFVPLMPITNTTDIKRLYSYSLWNISFSSFVIIGNYNNSLRHTAVDYLRSWFHVSTSKLKMKKNATVENALNKTGSHHVDELKDQNKTSFGQELWIQLSMFVESISNGSFLEGLRNDETHDEFGPWSIQIRVFTSLLVLSTVVAFVSSRKFSGKFFVWLLVIIIVHFTIVSIETSYRKRLVQRSKVHAVEDFIHRKSANHFEYESFMSKAYRNHTDISESMLGHNRMEDSEKIESSSMSSQHSNENVSIIATRSDVQHYTTAVSMESIAWLNSMFSFLWTVFDDSLNDGGLGLYMNEVYEDMLSTELAAIPPKVANLRLKKFDFGSNPPMFKSLQARLHRNSTCLDDLFQHNHIDLTTHRIDGQRKGFKGMRGHSRKSNYHNVGSAFHTPNHNSAFTSSSAPKKGGIRSFADLLIYQLSDILQTTLLDHADGRKRKDKIQKSDLLRYFYVNCDKLVLEIDLLFISKDMDIILTLRSSELKSVLPEIQLKVSEVIFEGIVQFEVSLTPDFPFFGNATVS